METNSFSIQNQTLHEKRTESNLFLIVVRNKHDTYENNFWFVPIIAINHRRKGGEIKFLLSLQT
jgi:hypothetical protein